MVGVMPSSSVRRLLVALVAALSPALLGSQAPPAPPAGCTPPPPRPEPRTAEERARRAERAKYTALLAQYDEKLPTAPDKRLLMPVDGVRVRWVANTWGAPRGADRAHEGQDIFAARGTPIRSATAGYVWRKGTGSLGGLYVFIAGAGGRRYYYAHLQGYAKGLDEGDKVSTDTVIGYVGNTGNARTTPPHLHLGIYRGSRRTCDYAALNPLPLLADRPAGIAKGARADGGS